MLTIMYGFSVDVLATQQALAAATTRRSNRLQQGPLAAVTTCCSQMMLSVMHVLQGIDNPDQRMAQDLPQLCNTLAEVLSVLAAAPFSVVWYTWLVHQVRL